MGGSKKTETKQDNTIDPYTRQRIETATRNVRGMLSQNPFEAYEGQRIAGQSDQTQEAQAMLTGENMALSNNLLGAAADRALTATDYAPQQIEAGTFAGADLSAYQNPYQSEVIDAMAQDNERSRQIAVNDLQGSATAAGAYGGARHGVAEAETNRAYADIQARQSAELRARGFETAANLYSQDANRQLTADTTNARLDMQGEQLGLQAGGLLGQIGETVGRNTRADVALLNQFGLQDQANQQAELDAAYQEFLREEEDRRYRIGVEMGLLSGTPVVVDSNSTQRVSSNPGLLGVAGAGLSLAGGLGWSPLGGD